MSSQQFTSFTVSNSRVFSPWAVDPAAGALLLIFRLALEVVEVLVALGALPTVLSIG